MSDEQKIQEDENLASVLEERVEDDLKGADETDVESVIELDETLIKVQEELALLKEQNLRIQAVMQNVRRRAELDVEKAHKSGVEKFANEMLNVVDNLERGLAAAPEEEATKAIREGMQMTLDSMVAALERFKVEIVNPEGEAFNAEFHQAMSMVENAEVPSGTVLAVMQKGYTLHGRLLRPAMVMVSKGAPSVDTEA